LDSGNSADRSGALKALDQSEHEVARLALRHAITHAFPDVRQLAAIALAKKGDQAVATETGVNVLIGTLGWESEEELRSSGKKL
jgi:hypothetical protein